MFSNLIVSGTFEHFTCMYSLYIGKSRYIGNIYLYNVYCTWPTFVIDNSPLALPHASEHYNMYYDIIASTSYPNLFFKIDGVPVKVYENNISIKAKEYTKSLPCLE